MTEENKFANIKAEIDRARGFQAAAELLAGNYLVNDAVSRLYYYLLSYIRALLLSEGVEPKSHEGALGLLGLYFIKKGFVEPRVSHVFSKLMKYREEADYNPGFVFREEDYHELWEEVGSVVRLIEEYLRGKGLL